MLSVFQAYNVQTDVTTTETNIDGYFGSDFLTYFFALPVVSGGGGGGGGGLDPVQFSDSILGAYKNAIKGAVLNKICGQSRPSRAFKSIRNGAVVGATNGAYTGFVSGEMFGGEVTLGVSGFGGAVIGGFIGGGIGATRGLFTGVVLAEACDAAGAYN
jgi:hypothetical protein